jgi:hypothetical protein
MAHAMCPKTAVEGKYNHGLHLAQAFTGQAGLMRQMQGYSRPFLQNTGSRRQTGKMEGGAPWQDEGMNWSRELEDMSNAEMQFLVEVLGKLHDGAEYTPGKALPSIFFHWLRDSREIQVPSTDTSK